MHRETRRFLLGLLVVVACVLAAGLVIKWLLQSEPTELTGRLGDPGTAQPADEPALPPIVAPLAGSGESTGKTARPNGDSHEDEAVSSAAPEAQAGKSEGAAAPSPPTTQPIKRPPLSSKQTLQEMEAGFAALGDGKLVSARTRLNNALHGGLSGSAIGVEGPCAALQGGLPAADGKRVREALQDLADRTIFSAQVQKDDPLVQRYTVRAGDTLEKIARRYRISEDFLADINNIANKHMIRLGAGMKVVQGPFHAGVVKKDHTMHIYLQDVYLRSFGVALGMNGTTPTGTWKVINHLENPGWTDPQGKRWHPNDPKNPIGEFWIGLEGIGGEAVGKIGLGIHGTIEPETIGQDVSLGCVRMSPDDISTVYKLLVPGVSIVTVSD